MTKEKSKLCILVTLLGTLAIRLANVIHFGLSMGGDSGFYIGRANDIINSGIGFYVDNISTIWYWGYPSYLALFLPAFGENYYVSVIVQTILASLTCILLHRIMVRLGCGEGVACLLTLFYCLNNDIIMWDRYILSDCMGMVFECICIYCFYRYLSSEKWGGRAGFRWFTIWIISVVLFFSTRSNAISLILAMFFIIICIAKDTERKNVIGIIIGISVALFLLLLFTGEGVSYGIGYMQEYFFAGFKDGMVVSGRPEYDVVVPAEHIGNGLFILDVVKIVLKRTVMYWSVCFSGYSLGHRVFCYVTIMPVFAFSIVSVAMIFKDKKQEFYPFIIMVVFYCVIQVFTEVDFDQRYRSPIFMILIVICSYCADMIWKNIIACTTRVSKHRNI